jgi:Pre-mRNA splicing Prp18-interacting factor
MYSEVIREHEEFEEARKQIRQEELAQGKTPALDDEYKEHMFDNNAPVAHQDPRTKTTIRDLRIREDIANYLLDLSDVNSKGPKNQVKEGDGDDFVSENAMRFSGDAAKLLEQEKMVWDLIQHQNADINSVALPTATELIYKKIKEKQQEEIDARKNELAQKYGESQSLQADPNLIFAQTERYVEYTRDGKIKMEGKKKAYGKSKYEEDVYPGDHTSIWGSYWSEEFGWGYNCCYQTVKTAQCIGEKGRKNALLREYKLKKQREEQLKGFSSQLEEKEETITQEKKQDPQQTSFQAPQSKPTTSVIKPPSNAPPENAERKIQVEKPVQKGSPINFIPNPLEPVRTKKASSSSSSSSSSSGSSSSDSDSSSSSGSSKSRSRSKEKDVRRKPADKDRTKRKDQKEEIDPKKLNKAIDKERERMRERSKEKKGKDSKYNSVKGDSYDVTAEDMEAYRMTKKKFEDPMNKYL